MPVVIAIVVAYVASARLTPSPQTSAPPTAREAPDPVVASQSPGRPAAS